MGEIGEVSDIGAEKQVLGAVLLSSDQFIDVAKRVQPSDFYRPAHETIWRCMTEQANANEPIDAKLIAERLKSTGDLNRIGGPVYLFELVQGVMSTANATYYADIVHRYAGIRKIIQASSRIGQMAGQASGADLDELRQRARSEIDKAIDEAATVGGWVYERIDSSIELLETPTRLISSPWSDLDQHLGGFAPGRLYVIGARPGVGKTAAALQSAVHVSRRHNLASAIVSLEMSEEELHLRMLAQMAHVPFQRLERRQLNERDWDRVSEVSGDLSSLRINILDSGNVRVHDVWHHARTLSRRDQLGLIVVDYIQLMSSPNGGKQPRHEVVADFSRQLKLMAKDLNVPVLALSQLNRASTHRRDGRPTLPDLRETGAIEQDSDVVILLHRDLEGDNPEDMEFIIAKNRHGSTGTVRFRFGGAFQQIDQVVWTPTAILDREESRG